MATFESASGEPTKYMAAVKQPDGVIMWQVFDKEEDALKYDYRNSDYASLVAAHQQIAAQLSEQVALNEQLRRSLNDITGHVLTLCRVLGRLL